MARSYDLFFSYHTADAALATELVSALCDAGLSIFLDEREIEHFESITGRLVNALGTSKALMALYSATYPTRRACQFELTTAFAAGQRAGDPRQRVLVVNPEESVAHIEPVELRDALFWQAPAIANPQGMAELAEDAVRHLERLDGSLGDIRPLAPPQWFGLRGSDAPRFVGRSAAMWKVHSKLHESELSPMTGITGPGVAQIRGLAGIGKTLLAQEYALRFGAGYPGGVFWLELPGLSADGEGPDSDELEAERVRQVRDLAIRRGVHVDVLPEPTQVEAALAAEFARRGEAFLWVVDDVPSGLEAKQLRQWLAPHPLGRTLLTTRSREYGGLAGVVEPGVLTGTEAVELLSAHRAPAEGEEVREAELLAQDLGGHALGIELAGTLVAATAGSIPFAHTRERLANPSRDELELADELADVLPTGHSSSIAVTLLSSVALLEEEGRDLLRLASVLSTAPVPATLVERAFAEVDGLVTEKARDRGMRARRQAERVSLADRSDGGAAHTIHALVSRTIRFHDKRTERRIRLHEAAWTVVNETGFAVVERPGDNTELEPLIPHARQLVRDAPATETKAHSLDWLSKYDFDRGAQQSALMLRSDQVRLLADLFGWDDPRTLTARSKLGTTLRWQGRPREAQDVLEPTVAATMRLLGNDSAGALEALGSLAMALGDLGESQRARALAAHVFERQTELLGPEHRTTLTAMNNLASILLHMEKLHEAEELQKHVVVSHTKAHGQDDPETLTAIGNRAVMLARLGNLAEAQRLQQEVLDGCRRVWGPQHPTTLRAMLNLAATLKVLPRPQDAEEGVGRPPESGERILAARDLEAEAARTGEEALGVQHTLTVQAMTNLTATLWRMGKSDEARTAEERVLEACGLLGPEHQDSLRARSELMGTLASLGKNDEARDVATRWVARVGTPGVARRHSSRATGGRSIMLHGWGAQRRSQS